MQDTAWAVLGEACGGGIWAEEQGRREFLFPVSWFWVKLRKIGIHHLTFEGQVAKSIRTLELNFNFLSSAFQKPLRQDRQKVGKGKPYGGKAAGRKAGMNKFLFAVMAGMSQVRRQSVYSMGRCVHERGSAV